MPKGESCFKMYSQVHRKNIGQYARHLLFTFYPFRDEAYLKFPPITEKYVAKLQELGVMDILSRKKAIMKSFSEIVGQA